MHWPVVTSVSHATRALGSLARIASRTASEIWSATLSGWPMVTDSLVNRCVLRRNSGDTAVWLLWRYVMARAQRAARDGTHGAGSKCPEIKAGNCTAPPRRRQAAAADVR